MLQRDGGDVELVEVTEDGVVKLKLQGVCCGCPGATYTLKMGIERSLKQVVPEVTVMRKKVAEALDKVRPMLQRDGGDVELVEVTEDGVVKLRLQGACSG